MTYSLPFGLKQKPTNHYFAGGVIKFNVREGKLYHTIKRITKGNNATIFKGEVKSKTELEGLLEIKNFGEIQTIGYV